MSPENTAPEKKNNQLEQEQVPPVSAETATETPHQQQRVQEPVAEPDEKAQVSASASESEKSVPKKKVAPLVVEALPDTVKYKPGDEISYKGARFTLNGKDITKAAEYSVEEGTSWKTKDKELTVVVTYDDDEGSHVTTITLKRKSPMLIPIIIIILLLLAGIGGGLAWWLSTQIPENESGSYLIPQGNMTDEEAQAMLNEMAEKSRISVNIAPYMVLKDDNQLRVNFIVDEPNNGLSERLEVEQDGKVVYKSGILEPGKFLKWGESNGAHLGAATATIYAVNEKGADSGNPISIEVQIVDQNFKAPEQSSQASSSANNNTNN